MSILLIFGLLLILAIVIFIVQNTHAVILHFLAWQFEGSLALFLLLTLLVGVIISILIAIPLTLRKKSKVLDSKEKDLPTKRA